MDKRGFFLDLSVQKVIWINVDLHESIFGLRLVAYMQKLHGFTWICRDLCVFSGNLRIYFLIVNNARGLK